MWKPSKMLPRTKSLSSADEVLGFCWDAVINTDKERMFHCPPSATFTPQQSFR